MGEVYEATHTSMNRRVALKVLAPEVATSGIAVARFFREAQAVRRSKASMRYTCSTSRRSPMELSERNHARELCGADTAGPCASEDGVAAWSDAKDAGNVSTVGFIAGGVLLATGVVLWLTAPKSAPPTPARVGFVW